MSMKETLVLSGAALLDQVLLTHSYVGGHCPSNADVALYQNIKANKLTVTLKGYINILRWYTHLDSFTKAETINFEQLNLRELNILGVVHSVSQDRTQKGSCHSVGSNNIVEKMKPKASGGGGGKGSGKEEVRYLLVIISNSITYHFF